MDKAYKWITGLAVHGDGRGRPLGFPTANLVLANPKEIPEHGVYAVWGKILPNTKQMAGALHVGPRPTFGDLIGTVELHFLDFPDRDLYGQSISFLIVERLRAVENFATIQALTDALRRDCERAREILTENPE